MVRWISGIAAFLFLVTGIVLAFRGDSSHDMPEAPEPRLAASRAIPISQLPSAPVADPKSKEEKRFDRADKDDDGRISRAELMEPRRKAFATLDGDSDGRLSFEEWAAKSIDKFDTADADHSSWLTRAEFATTAPKPKKKKKAVCSC